MSDIKALKRVSAYRTTDGKLHDTRIEAERHQGKLDLIAWAEQSRGGEAGPDALADLLIFDAPKVIEMLRSATKTAKADAEEAPTQTEISLDAAAIGAA